MLLPELEEDEEGDWGGDYEEAAHLVVMMVMKVMMLMTMMVIMVTIGDKHKQAANHHCHGEWRRLWLNDDKQLYLVIKGLPSL